MIARVAAAQVLLHAHGAGVPFGVIVADAGPKFEGRETLGRLVAKGLECTYADLHALPYMMPKVTKAARDVPWCESMQPNVCVF